MTTALKPAYLWVPPRLGSYGDEAIDLARMAGRELDPEQCLAVDAELSYGPGGRPVALESVVIEARQNGKTGGDLMPVVLFDLFLCPPDRIVWTAHLFKTARDAFADFVHLITNTAELSRRVKRIAYANGEESIELHPPGNSSSAGARLEFLARSKGGGRGLGGKRLVMDEALFLSAESMGALIPTLSARRDPQINYGSSAGVGTSDHLRRLRDRGRAGGDPSLVYVERCAPGSWADPPCVAGRACTHVAGLDGCALDDESLWPAANHAIGRRITYEYVRAERRALPAAEFGRERLGWWDDPDTDVEQVLADWLACADAESIAVGRPVLAVDVSPRSRSAAILAATRRPDGLPHLEVVEFRPGTGWLAARCAELDRDHEPLVWVAHADGPVKALLPELAAVGVEPHLLTSAEMGAACEAFTTAAAERTVRHVGDPILARALAGAVARDVGDGMRAWSRKRSDVDICPLYAATEALWRLAALADYDVGNSFY